MNTALSLALGYALALLYLRSRRSLSPHRQPVFWATGLVVATALYIVFALLADAPFPVLAREAGGTLLFITLAWVSTRKPVSRQRWLAAGWLLHPLWDLGAHHGSAHAPDWYMWACLSFDLVVGIALATSASGNENGLPERPYARHDSPHALPTTPLPAPSTQT